MKLVGYLAVFVAGIVSCYLLLSLGIVDAVDDLPGTQTEPAVALPTYLSFISVLLTSVTAAVTAVAIGIGIVAAYTFREIKDEAQRTATKAAQDTANKALSEEVIRARIDEIAFADKSITSSEELEEGFDPEDTGER